MSAKQQDPGDASGRAGGAGGGHSAGRAVSAGPGDGPGTDEARQGARVGSQGRAPSGPQGRAQGVNRSASSGQPQGRAEAGARELREEVVVISVAAEITGMHAQTLRTYDRMGLVTPERTRGGGRRYSRRDIEQLLEIQRLSHEEGVNLAGIRTIIELQSRVEDLEQEVAGLRRRLAEAKDELRQARESGEPGGRPRGEIVHVPRSTAVVLWEQRRGRRR